MALLCLLVVAHRGHSATPPAPSAESRAMQVLQANCLSCHNDEKKKGGLSLATREAALRGGDNGEVLTPGTPARSRLLTVLAPDADPHMPPKRQLAREEIRTLERWLKAGAKWDAAALLNGADLAPIQFEPLPDRYRPVSAAAMAAGSSRVAVGQGAHVMVIEAGGTNAGVVARAATHPEGVQSVAWDPQERWVASGGFRRVVVSDAGGLEPRWILTNGLAGRITSLLFADGGATLIVADSLPGQRAFLRVLEVSNGVIRASWPAHGDTIYGMDLSGDGRRLATAGGDKLIKIWDWEKRSETGRLEGHAGAVYGVAFNSNATRVVSAAADKELKVWDVDTREKIINLGRVSSPWTSVRWLVNPTNEAAILAANEAGEVFRYTDLKAHSGEQSSSGGTERRIAEAGETILCLAQSADGRRILAGTARGSVHLWNRDGKVLATFDAEALARAIPPQPGPAVPEAAATASASLSFVRDVLPVLSKAGCNAGACHAKPEGQNGFKLSVFSYDPRADYAEIVTEGRGRRIFPGAPGESLILRKPTLGVPHEGGERFKVGSPEYELVARWIREGMNFQNTNEPALVRIEVTPSERRYKKRSRQRLAVTARYSDGSSRDVTRLVSFNSSDKEVAAVDEQGLVRVGTLTGEGVIVARYMGFVADSKVTVPADKRLAPSRYVALPVNNLIDRLAYAQFQNLGLYPSDPCSDAEFLRRASLDTTGVLPTPEQVREFLGDAEGVAGAGAGTGARAKAPSRAAGEISRSAKRRALIDRLLEEPAFGDYWANKFADLLRPNPDRVGVKSVFTLDQWLRESFHGNKPYDQFVREILTAEGSNHRDGPAVIYRDRREPSELTTMFSQLFLGVRLECARCHHHPNEKWSQDDFYQFAAYFGAVKQKGAGLSPPISAGTETFYFAPGGSVKHPVSGAVMVPKPPDGEPPALAVGADPRRALADWLTRPDNPFFARAIVNRVWAGFFGRGLVEPVDDFRISNPCANAALLDGLARDFVDHRFDLRHLMRTILQSHLYQLSSEPNETNMADTRNFSRAYRRRLPAEVLLDAVNDVTGVPDTSAALAAGSRSMQMWSYKIESQFLDAFGRPNSSSDCPCERDTRTSVVQSLHLMHSKNLQAKLAHENGRVRRLAGSARTPAEIVTELYLAALNRFPTAGEMASATAVFDAAGATRQTAAEDVLWALLNSVEFVFNH